MGVKLRRSSVFFDSAGGGIDIVQMAKASAHCPFCDLIRGAAEVSVCYEDAKALAFMDIQPVNAGHVLVVPKAHVETLSDVPYDLAMHLFGVAMRIAPVIRKIAGADDMNIVVNSGAAAGRTSFIITSISFRGRSAMGSIFRCRSMGAADAGSDGVGRNRGADHRRDA